MTPIWIEDKFAFVSCRKPYYDLFDDKQYTPLIDVDLSLPNEWILAKNGLLCSKDLSYDLEMPEITFAALVKDRLHLIGSRKYLEVFLNQ